MTTLRLNAAIANGAGVQLKDDLWHISQDINPFQSSTPEAGGVAVADDGLTEADAEGEPDEEVLFDSGSGSERGSSPLERAAQRMAA